MLISKNMQLFDLPPWGGRRPTNGTSPFRGDVVRRQPHGHYYTCSYQKICNFLISGPWGARSATNGTSPEGAMLWGDSLTVITIPAHIIKHITFWFRAVRRPKADERNEPRRGDIISSNTGNYGMDTLTQLNIMMISVYNVSKIYFLTINPKL